MLLDNTRLRTFYPIFMVFCLFFFSNPVFASKNEDMERYQNKLKELQDSISKIQRHLKDDKKQRSDVVIELKTLELDISKNSKKLKKLENDLQKTRQLKNTLERELRQLDKQMATQKAALSEQIRSSYTLGQQQHLKMLLNQEDPAQVGRAQEYFNYFNKARTQQISLFLNSIEQKKQTEHKHKEALNKHQQLVSSQKDKTRKIQKQRLKRKKLLAELGNKIENQESTLSSLEGSRNRIENLLESLGELLADVPSSPTEKSPFKSLKGRLPWPVNGKFIGQFGRSKQHGDLKWNGVLIKAKYGTPVRAISHGRVAFSDWLQGFGFISIIDHGGGYMSLYGYSETLLKQAGDWVQAGEIIATAGDSGGQTQSGVYFEIRSRGKPVNPAKWCSKSAKHASK